MGGGVLASSAHDSSDVGTAQHAGRSLRALQDSVAGAIAGAVSRIVVGPLDVVKIRFQVQLEPIRAAQRAAASKYTGVTQALVSIAREEGIRGLWRGTVPGLLLTVPYTAVQFATLHQCKSFAARGGWTSGTASTTASFCAGAIAGAAATAVSYPFDLLRTTLAAQGEPKVYHSMSHAARCMVRDGGWRALYRGLGITLLEIMPYAALQFATYDTLNTACNRLRHSMQHDTLAAHDGSKMQYFMVGLAAGIVGKLGTHPLDVAKKRVQVAGLQRSLSYGKRVDLTTAQSLGRCLATIAASEGLAGLYKGVLPNLIKAAPASAITFVVYEFLIAHMTRAQHA